MSAALRGEELPKLNKDKVGNHYELGEQLGSYVSLPLSVC